MTGTALELQNVSMNFGQKAVLENVSVEVLKQESVVLIGPSGQGKTTLIKIMAGLLKPKQGKLFLSEKNYHLLSEKEKGILTRKVGMLFQKNALFDSLSVFDNVAFPLRELTTLNASEISEKVLYYLEAVGLTASAKLLPHEISGGMQKRLGIARALALSPEMIFYDDPTAGLDPITSKKIIELILKLQNDLKSTLVTITNDMNRAYQLADRIYMVVDKEVIILGSKEETLSHEDPRVVQFVRGQLEGPLSVNG